MKHHVLQSHHDIIPASQVDAISHQSKRQVSSIPSSDCPFCTKPWAESDAATGTKDEILVVDIAQFRRHVGHHMQQVAMFALPRFIQDMTTESQAVGGSIERDDTLIPYRWVRDDTGPGWAKVAHRRGTFIAMSAFLKLFRAPKTKIFSGHKGAVLSVAYSPTGDILASASADTTVILWNVGDGATHQVLTGHSKSVAAIAFSPDSETLASGSVDGTIKLWSTAGKLNTTLQTDVNFLRSVEFSSDGTMLVSSFYPNKAILWDLKKNEKLFQIGDGTCTVKFSNDDKLLAVGTNNGRIDHWRTKDGIRVKLTPAHTGWVRTLAYSPAIPAHSQHSSIELLSGSDDAKIKAWGRVETDMAELCVLNDHSAAVLTIAMSPYGTGFASGSKDGTVRIWSTLISPPHAHDILQFMCWVNSVAFSPNGKWLAVGLDDCTMAVINLAKIQKPHQKKSGA